MTVYAATAWKSNAELIEACVELGYLSEHKLTLDPTYGLGTFWKNWRPHVLTATDISRTKTQQTPEDFRCMPWEDGTFEQIVFDPPYKLNGTPDEVVDGRYGVDTPTRWQDRMQVCKDGIDEMCRLLAPRGFLLIKCQDQVCSGKVRWQSREFAERAEAHGLEHHDSLLFLGGREQPPGTRQLHARRNLSTLLVMRKGKL